MKPMASPSARRLRAGRRTLALMMSCLLCACGPGPVEYSDEERVSLMLSNLESRSGESFWHRYLEDLSIDGERAIAVTSNVLVSSRICLGLASSAVDADGGQIGVDTIEIRDLRGNVTYECSR
jgi:hypothetical protein